MSWFKPHLERLTAYPYKKVEAAIKLDQNESPWDLPDELKEAALRRLRALSWNRYPDMHAESLRAALAGSGPASTSTSVVGETSQIRRVASIPLSSGMSRSTTATSGLSWSASSTAMRPSIASPQTRQPGCASDRKSTRLNSSH